MLSRYTDQILDEDTGLYYYNARYYDPELGRFTQADTIVPGAGNPQNLNRYSYVLNNPLNGIDPTGHGFVKFFKRFIDSIGHWVSSGSSNSSYAVNFTLQGTASLYFGLDFFSSGVFRSGVGFGLGEMSRILAIAEEGQRGNMGASLGRYTELGPYECSEQCADIQTLINGTAYSYWEPARITGGVNLKGQYEHALIISPTSLGVYYGFHDFIIEPFGYGPGVFNPLRIWFQVRDFFSLYPVHNYPGVLYTAPVNP